MITGVCDLPGERCYHPISCEERGCVKKRTPIPKPPRAALTAPTPDAGVTSLAVPLLNPPHAEDHPLLAVILDKRRRAAANFTEPFSGQRGEDFDRGLLCAFEAVNGELQRLTSAALAAPPTPRGEEEGLKALGYRVIAPVSDWFIRNADRANPKAAINYDAGYFGSECASLIVGAVRAAAISLPRGEIGDEARARAKVILYETVERVEANTFSSAAISENVVLEAMCAFAAATPAPVVGDGEKAFDDAAVDRFAALMKAKLDKARAKGRGGWNDPMECSPAILSGMLHEHVAKGDPVDVANFCMMIDHYGAPIAATPASVTPDAGDSEQTTIRARIVREALVLLADKRRSNPRR